MNDDHPTTAGSDQSTKEASLRETQRGTQAEIEEVKENKIKELEKKIDASENEIKASEDEIKALQTLYIVADLDDDTRRTHRKLYPWHSRFLTSDWPTTTLGDREQALQKEVDALREKVDALREKVKARILSLNLDKQARNDRIAQSLSKPASEAMDFGPSPGAACFTTSVNLEDSRLPKQGKISLQADPSLPEAKRRNLFSTTVSTTPAKPYESEQWYHVTGSIVRPKTHAGARFKLFELAGSSNGLYPEGLDSESAFETVLSASDKNTTLSVLRFSVVFKTEDNAWEFTQSLGRYLQLNRGDLELRDYEGEAKLETPKVARISQYPTSMTSRVSSLHYKSKEGEVDPSSPILDVVFQTRSSDYTAGDTVTCLSTNNEVFQYQRIENAASFDLAEAEAAHIIPSSKCIGPYKWLDDKPFNRLALSGDVHLNFDGTARGRAKHRKTAQTFAIKPVRKGSGFSVCEKDGVLCYEIPLELVVNQSEKAGALLRRLGNNCHLHHRANGFSTINGTDVRIFYPKNRRFTLVMEATDEGELRNLVTAIPSVTDLSECWSSVESNPLSIEGAEILEKCLVWNYENALETWASLG